MTGIERLRRLARSQNMDNAWTAMLSHELCDIADQIERETRDAAEVRKDAERALCVELDAPIDEGADPLDVLRRHVGCLTDTIENLRLELGEARDRSADVSMNAYDLLPPDERDAIAWVREHGGLDEVEAHWEGYVPASWLEKAKSRYERKRDNLKAHAWDLERKCGERRERIRELERERDELRTRVMPEGMEWLVEAWPRFEDDAPVRFLDDFERYGDENGVSAVTMYSDGSFALNCRAYSKGEHVNRPAPKVFDTDGVEIREKGDVWWICEGDDRGIHAERLRVETIGPNGLIECSPYNGGTWVYLEPSELYVNKPVLAADGKPLHEGETAWDKDGTEWTIACIDIDFLPDCVQVRGADRTSYVKPSQLTHERPDSYDALFGDVVFKGITREEFMRRAKALTERDA